MTELTDRDLTGRIINAFYCVYDELGYGFLETVYKNALALEFALRGIPFAREHDVEVYYKGSKISRYRADFVVDGRVTLEVKATFAIDDGDRRQLRNYLKATEIELGFLLHFGPKASFHRLIHTNDRKRSLRPAVVSRP